MAKELQALGAAVEVVADVHNLALPEAAPALVAAAMNRLGHIDSAVASSVRIVVGRFLMSSIDDLRAAVQGCLEAPYHFLRAVVPVMVDQGEGQVLVTTSASAVRPTPGAPLYSSARAAANMLVRNVADEIAAHGVQVNGVGTNFMDFPDFLVASKATTPERRAKVEALVPMGRLGTMEEFAHFCMPFLDGMSRFTTGQFVAYAGAGLDAATACHRTAAANCSGNLSGASTAPVFTRAVGVAIMQWRGDGASRARLGRRRRAGHE